MRKHLALGVTFLLLGIVSLALVAFFFIPGLFVGPLFILIGAWQFIAAYRKRNSPATPGMTASDLALYLILLLFLGYFAFLTIRFFSRQDPQALQPLCCKPMFDAPARTYRNSTFGFEFQYPATLAVGMEGPNDVWKKEQAGEQTSGTVPPILDTISFSDHGKEQFAVLISAWGNVQPGQTSNQALTTENLAAWSYGSYCDLRWADSVVSGPSLVNTGNLTLLSTQVKGQDGEIDGCYYFKDLKNHVVSVNVRNYPQQSTLLRTLIPTLKLIN